VVNEKFGFVTSVDSMRPSAIGQPAARLRLSQRHELMSQPPSFAVIGNGSYVPQTALIVTWVRTTTL
jgi:hypothetical protein